MHSAWNHPNRGIVIFASVAIVGLLLAARAQVVDTNYQCVQYEATLAKAALSYAQDYDENFPPKFATTADLTHYLKPYLHSSVVYTCPDTHRNYVPNTALAGKSLSSLDLTNTWMLQDAVAHKDRLSTVTYVDGRTLHGGRFLGDIRDLCMENTRALTLAMVEYAQDYDEILPPMPTYKKFDSLIDPYVRAPWRFTCPETGRFYQPNAAISGMPIAKITYPADTVSVTEIALHADGYVTSAYLDGHAVHGSYQSGGKTYYGSGNLEQQCIANVRQIGLGLLMYAQDYDETLPPMHTITELKSRLVPYVAKDGNFLPLFTCPATQLLYTPNGGLSGKTLAAFANWSTTITIKDTKPHVDGKYTYGYLDGHADRH